MTECPDWLKPLDDGVKAEYNDIWQNFEDNKERAARELHDDLHALYLEHYPEGDKGD
jgi:hypothetical protein